MTTDFNESIDLPEVITAEAFLAAQRAMRAGVSADSIRWIDGSPCTAIRDLASPEAPTRIVEYYDWLNRRRFTVE